MTLRRYLRSIIVSGGLLLATASPVSAELILGLTTQNTLISFDSATPGTVATIGSVTGLTAGDTLVGIDFRPATGDLYAVGANLATGIGSVYSIDETTAAATLVAPLSTAVQGTSFGLDFNPLVDRLRLTSNTGQNLRINVDNGVTIVDTPLNYQAGDPNFGDAPVVLAVAYSDNFAGTATTTLRGVDIGQDTDLLVIHVNPNGGLLQTSLSLPFNSGSLTAYDISGLTGTPYFAVVPIGAGSSSLYAGTTLVGTIGGGVPLTGIAAPVGVAQVPEPSAMTLVALGLAGLLRRRIVHRRRRV